MTASEIKDLKQSIKCNVSLFQHYETLNSPEWLEEQKAKRDKLIEIAERGWRVSQNENQGAEVQLAELRITIKDLEKRLFAITHRPKLDRLRAMAAKLQELKEM